MAKFDAADFQIQDNLKSGEIVVRLKILKHTIIILSIFIFLVFPVGDRHNSLVGGF
jgi:hypothetical protein